jgi:N-acetylneuraminate lyase
MFDGILPAIITPFDTDGNLNTAELVRFVRHFLENGAHGFFVCGSAGEGVLMTREERRRVTELVAGESAGQAKVIAHVGAMSTDEAAMLARDAKEAGADGVASLPPLFFRVPWDGIIEHMKAIAAGADLPTLYYHIPEFSGVRPSAEELVRLLEEADGVAGIKFSSEDLFALWSLRKMAGEDAVLLSGCDQQLYQSLLSGANGGIGSTYNYQIENVVGVYEALKRGDHEAAQESQWRINEVVSVLFRHGSSRATEKMMVTLRGFDVGAPRRPNTPFDMAGVEALRKDMAAVGLI